MPNTFDEFEIGLVCPTCGEPFDVTGKRLTQSRDVPCPACGEVTRVDVWGFHAQWARMRKLLSKL